MRKKTAILIAVATLLLVGIFATSVLASDLGLTRNTKVSTDLLTTAENGTPERIDSVKDISQTAVISEAEDLPEIEIEKLEELVPRTYEETGAQLSSTRTRFLLYTHNGKHIMWGWVGNGYFVGQDNLGKRCWGIYGKGVFAGFYDGEFFWGRYRSGYWKAMGLFEENYTHGEYILFPTIELEPSIAEPIS